VTEGDAAIRGADHARTRAATRAGGRAGLGRRRHHRVAASARSFVIGIERARSRRRWHARCFRRWLGKALFGGNT
jgi:hypothetical protein